MILPDVRGLYRFYEELALRFAERGIAAVAIDYFGRTAGGRQARTTSSSTWSTSSRRRPRASRPIGAAVAHLRRRSCSSIFTVGFCFGGRNSWLAAASGHGLAGAIGFYGNPIRAGGRAGADAAGRRDGGPILALQAGDDKNITAEANAAFDEALTAPASSTSSSRTRARRTASSTARRRSTPRRPPTRGSACWPSSPATAAEFPPSGKGAPMSAEALERLRDALREVELGARPARTRPRRGTRARARRAGRRLPAAAAAAARRAAADGRRRLDRRGQVDARQQPRRRDGQPGGRPAADHARARARLQSGRSALVRGRPRPARALRARPAATAAARAACSSCRPPALAEGLALLDSPDIDSVAHENRALADQLLAAADAWLFVTTAARYADAVPWELLQAARERGTVVAVVLNRVPADAAARSPRTSREMLDERGLGGRELLVVPESRLDGRTAAGGRARAGARLARRARGGRAGARGADRAGRSRGALASMPRARRDRRARARPSSSPAAAELRAAGRRRLRRRALRGGRGGAAQRLAPARRGARPLARGRRDGRADARARDAGRLGARPAAQPRAPGRRPPTPSCSEAVETGVEAVVRAAADARGRADGARRGGEHAPGRALLDGAAELERASRGLAPATADEVRAWQGDVFDLVRERGRRQADDGAARLARRQRRRADRDARRLRQTGGLTGAEVVVAGGTSALGQKVLEAIFGDQAVRTLAARAREDLLERVRAPARRRGGAVRRAARRRSRPSGAAPRGAAARRAPRTLGARVTAGDLDAAAAPPSPRRPSSRAGGSTTRSSSARARRSSSRRARASGSGVEATVVALAGPTGAGKSTLFNALAGAELPAVGRRRPTTAAARGGGLGRRRRTALLDWLDVPRRHRLHGGELDGLVLLDLPGLRLGRARAPARGRPARRARRPRGLGRRPAEVRRRRAARPLPAPARARTRARWPSC